MYGYNMVLESLVVSKMHLNCLLQTSTLEGKNHSIENCASFESLSMHACSIVHFIQYSVVGFGKNVIIKFLVKFTDAQKCNKFYLKGHRMEN